MANQPFYHLRPNKNIDRNLFIQTLIGLSRVCQISSYQYTGFGSYLFDDFKLLHDTLNISRMVSLEKEPREYSRAMFNLPYNCIDIKNVTSTEHLSELVVEDDDHNIFWLDYVKPDELGAQLADYSTLLDLLNPYDIVRITLNANPSSLGKAENPDDLQAIRLKRIRERVPECYFPSDAVPENMTREQYPLLLLRILKTATMLSLDDNPPYSPNFLLPLFATVYADGQQMLTFTGIVLNSHDHEKQIKEALKAYPHNTFAWDKPCKIEIPPLSVREITEINKSLPDHEGRQQILDQFSFVFSSTGQEVDSYISYYKYYPNFHLVSF